MKIGAGGLQTQVTHDDVTGRQAREARRPEAPHKPGLEGEAIAALNKDALNKTVERLNDAAQSFDLPLRFVQKDAGEGGKRIEMLHTELNKAELLELGDAEALVNKIYVTKGLVLDEYI